MKNKKGFTLIELLAVIVILAIIATIATPLVLGYIEKTKKETAKVSAKEYLKAIEQNNMTAKIDKNYSIIESGDVEDINSQINIKGDKPTSGQVIIDNSTVNLAALCINDFKIDYIDEKISVSGKCDGEVKIFGGEFIPANKSYNYHTFIAEVYLDPENLSNKCNKEIYDQKKGSLDYTKRLGDGTNSLVGINSGCMRWYAYKKDNDKYYLILEHNSSGNVAHFIEDSCKNINLTSELKEEVVSERLEIDSKTWSPVLKLNKTLDNFDYNGYKARLITADEIAEITGADKALLWSSDKPFVTHIDELKIGTNVHQFYLDGARKFYVDGTWTTDPLWGTSTAKKGNASDYLWLYKNLSGCTTYGCGVIEDNNRYPVVNEMDANYGLTGCAVTGKNYLSSAKTTCYWTSTPLNFKLPEGWSSSYDDNYYVVASHGALSTSDAYSSYSCGIRPVIEVPKYFFE